jgi:hypothetical protein
VSSGASYAFTKTDDKWDILKTKYEPPSDFPPGLPTYVSPMDCHKQNATWICYYNNQTRILSFQDGSWKSGTIPKNCYIRTSFNNRWYTGCVHGLKVRDKLFGTDKWLPVKDAPDIDWSTAEELSNGELVGRYGSKGRFYILSESGIHQYTIAADRFTDIFEIENTVLAVSGTSVYCIKRPFQ